jgi:hypothetical protein
MGVSKRSRVEVDWTEMANAFVLVENTGDHEAVSFRLKQCSRQAGPQLGQMRPFDFRNCVGQVDDLTAWGITLGDWVDYRLFSGLHMMTVGEW